LEGNIVNKRNSFGGKRGGLRRNRLVGGLNREEGSTTTKKEEEREIGDVLQGIRCATDPIRAKKKEKSCQRGSS